MTNKFNEGLKNISKEIEGFMYTYGHYLSNEQYKIFKDFKENISKEFNI